MTKSRDRVRFTIKEYMVNRTAVREAFMRAFGSDFDLYAMMRAKDGQEEPSLRFECRPSQFARFLIYINEMAGANTFKMVGITVFSMQPELIQVKCDEDIIKLDEITAYPR